MSSEPQRGEKGYLSSRCTKIRDALRGLASDCGLGRNDLLCWSASAATNNLIPLKHFDRTVSQVRAAFDNAKISDPAMRERFEAILTDWQALAEEQHAPTKAASVDPLAQKANAIRDGLLALADAYNIPYGNIFPKRSHKLPLSAPHNRIAEVRAEFRAVKMSAEDTQRFDDFMKQWLDLYVQQHEERHAARRAKPQVE